jgi:outer membrane protein TolC
MRWITGIGGLALLLAIGAGCKQQCFLTEADFCNSHDGLAVLPHIDATGPACPNPNAVVPEPPTIDSPEREICYLSLSEAFALALDHGTVGAGISGTASDTLVQFAGRGISGSDPIRAFALDPAIVGADIEASLAKFDARWNTSMSWTNTDRPVGTALDTFQAGATLNAIRTEAAQFQTQLIKPLPTGGTAGITFTTPYSFTNLPSRTNPSYTPALQFGFEQPLLQGWGVEINQLRASHPGSSIFPFNTGGRVEGILITRIRFDQERAEFERTVNQMLLNVELAYWTLYGRYWTLYSREQALRQSFEAWRINKARFETGKIAIAELEQTRGQYEQFRSQRLTALGDVLEGERNLRALLGLPPSDCKRLVPADAPTLAQYKPDWCSAQQEALALRPELVLARQELKFRQLDLISQKNLLLPDLRLTSTYDLNNIGSRLDGPDAQNAFRNLSSNHFNNWNIGLSAQVTLGYRDANSAVRVARLNLMRTYITLNDQELKTTQYLVQQYRHLFEFYDQIAVQRSNREAQAKQLDARYKEFLAGRGTLDFLLEAQRNWADALAAEYGFIVQYNQALANWQWAKGTLLQHDGVVIGEGPLPCCAQMKAVDHTRERTRALVLREREHPVTHKAVCPDQPGSPIVPQLSTKEAPTLPALYEGAPKPLPPDATPASTSSLPDFLPSKPITPASGAFNYPGSPTGQPAGVGIGPVNPPTSEPDGPK